MSNDLVFSGPTHLGKSTIQIEVERCSQERLEQDQHEADRVKRISLAAETFEKHAGIVETWRKAHQVAQEQHNARLQYYHEHYLGRKPERHQKLPDTPALQFCHEGPGYAAPDPQLTNIERHNLAHHVEYWFSRHMPEIEAGINGSKQKRISRHQWYGEDGLRARYLEKMLRAAAEADGVEFDFK